MAHRGRKTADAALLAALVGGATVGDAAAVAGVARRTAQRRLADPEFCARLRQAQEEMFRRGLGDLSAGFSEGVAALRALLVSGTPGIQLRAAVALVAHAPRIRESEVLEQRLAALEERLNGA